MFQVLPVFRVAKEKATVKPKKQSLLLLLVFKTKID